MRGHCLLWHHPRWLPRWLDSYDFGNEPVGAAEKLLTDHISRTTSHFKRIVSWDVVNEAVDNVTGEMRETPLSKAMGSPDKVLELAFNAARANLPTTELVYNDYMGWEANNAPHRDGVLKLLERFRKNKVPVNALGLQSHIGAGNQDANSGRAFDARDERAWRKFLEDVTAMGYSLLITEFDVHDAPLAGGFRATRPRRRRAGSRLPGPDTVIHAGERRVVLGTDGYAYLVAGTHAARRRAAQTTHALRQPLSGQAAARSHGRGVSWRTPAQTGRHRGDTRMRVAA